MSSNDCDKSISASDLSLIHAVLESVGFRHAEPMTEADRDAACFVIAQFKQGIRDAEHLQLALTHRTGSAKS